MIVNHKYKFIFFKSKKVGGTSMEIALSKFTSDSDIVTKIMKDEEEALKISNDVEYGLTGYIWTNNVTRALRFSDELEAGMIWVNSENVRHLPTPFGGIKSSGIGRDGGDWSFEFYMEQKHIGFGHLHKSRKNEFAHLGPEGGRSYRRRAI